VARPTALSFRTRCASTRFADASLTIGRVETLQAALGVPARLRDIGVERALLPRIAAKTMGERGL
jgi:alcohol dehydrogenase class IV